ncbi:amyloid protein-binding protein 2-like protein, partial [Dinothrombium tinctorium]
MLNLYENAISVIVRNYSTLREQVKCLPIATQFDLYYRLYVEKQYTTLANELCDLSTFAKLLIQCEGRRHLLHRCFQGVIDTGCNLASELASNFRIRVNNHLVNSKRRDDSNRDECCKFIIFDEKKLLKFGLALSSFLIEAGWFAECELVLLSCIYLSLNADRSDRKLDDCDRISSSFFISSLTFDSYVKLLHVYNNYFRFEKSEPLLKYLQQFIDELQLERNEEYNIAQAYIEYSQFYSFRSEYEKAFFWSEKALSLLTSKTPVITVIDVLRQSAKACVVKREFKKAEMLIKNALLVAKDVFRIDEPDWLIDYPNIHPKIADLFLDYGFYLLNVDLINQSVKLYQMALQWRQKLFQGDNDSDCCRNLLVALAHEDLAYATYVCEYSSGEFDIAKDHIDTALTILEALLPENHLRLASAKRVKALIIEEIAIDHPDKVTEQKMLQESQELHFSALNMARNTFGEMNVQTAKHYGNLGRLYQSMHRFVEAEQMHIKAISIKEKLLGCDDYEVGLSSGHLASLYNYDMLLFEKAEKLYLKSLSIGIKLFGECYSGLEYDYRGLLRVYSNLNNREKVEEYSQIFSNWLYLRESVNSVAKEKCPLRSLLTVKKLSPDQIYNIFKSD